MSKPLTYFITLNKLTEELILKEGNLVSLKIPKQWQKPDANINNPALWVCHLPTNYFGISIISLYPSELVIKKNNQITTNYSEETEEELKETENYDESTLIVYKETLEPNGETEKERFYRCKLKKQEETKPEVNNEGGIWAVIIIIVIVCVFIGIISKN